MKSMKAIAVMDRWSTGDHYQHTLMVHGLKCIAIHGGSNYSKQNNTVIQGLFLCFGLFLTWEILHREIMIPSESDIFFKPRKFNTIALWKDIKEEQWNDPAWQIKHSIRSVDM
jgi:hypothetical protein